MTFTRGLFIHPDATRGTTALESRQALAGIITSPGVLDGLRGSGTAGWQYRVSDGHVATSRGIQTDGVVLFGNDANVLVDCSPAPGTGARIDIVYAKHNDTTTPNADPDSEAFAAVAEGVASGTPNAPDLPDGAVELFRATVGAGATNTAHANVTIDHSHAPVAEIYTDRQDYAGSRESSGKSNSIPDRTATTVHALYGSDGNIPNATGGGLTAPVDGRYYIEAAVRLYGVGSGNTLQLRLTINGSVSVYNEVPGAAGGAVCSLSRVLKLSEGDEIYMQAWQNSGETLSVSPLYGVPYLSAVLVGRD